MVMIFSNEKARHQLLKKKRVCTFRKSKRREGRDWATDHYGGKKIANIEVSLVSRCRPLDLYAFVSLSGFKKFEDWIRVIQEFGIESQQYGYLYEVRRTK